MLKIAGFLVMRKKELECLKTEAVLDFLNKNATLVPPKKVITPEEYHPGWAGMPNADAITDEEDVIW